MRRVLDVIVSGLALACLAPFFLITTVAALPGLAFLLWLTLAHRRNAAISNRDAAEPPSARGA